MIDINFHAEDREIPEFVSDRFKTWILTIIKQEGFQLATLNYVFCSDDYLLEINKEHLEHDYYTDIITFDNSEDEQTIEGDIFISLDRVKDNAKQLEISFENELQRVMAHGVLHLCGYGDKSIEEIAEMRSKEEEVILLYNI